MERMCASCGANPAAESSSQLCICCWQDLQTAEKAELAAKERARIEARRRGRPAWKPDYYRGGHGHGTERLG